MSDSQLKATAKQQLESRGFDAEVVTEGEEKTPDLVARAEGLTYRLEIKAKFFDGVRDADAVTATGYRRRDPLRHSNTISSKVREGAQQLRTESQAVESLRVLWMLPQGYHQRLIFDRIRYTVYGIKVANVRFEEGSSESRECYFAYHSEFFRNMDLDGVLVGTFQVLLLNPLSNGCRILRQSRLAGCVQYVEYPPAEVEAGNSFLLESQADRNDVPRVEAELRSQLGAEHVELMNLIAYSAVIGEGDQDA